MAELKYDFDIDEFLREHPDLNPDLREALAPGLAKAEEETFRFVMGLIYG